MTLSGQNDFVREDLVRRLAETAREQARRVIGTLAKFDPKTETVSCDEE